MQSSSLEGTVALVSGASSGIGRAVCELFAVHRAEVFAMARRGDVLGEIAHTLNAKGLSIIPVVGDVCEPDDIAAAVERAASATGSIDTVVNAAGILESGDVEHLTQSEVSNIITTNLTALIELSQSALPALELAAQKGPRGIADIVNIGSLAGTQTSSGPAVYAASKHGVSAFSAMLRRELVSRGIRVSVIQPGAVATNLRRKSDVSPPDDEMLEPDDVAEIVRFVVAQPPRVAINEIVMRPARQLN